MPLHRDEEDFEADPEVVKSLEADINAGIALVFRGPSMTPVEEYFFRENFRRVVNGARPRQA